MNKRQKRMAYFLQVAAQDWPDRFGVESVERANDADVVAYGSQAAVEAVNAAYAHCHVVGQNPAGRWFVRITLRS